MHRFSNHSPPLPTLLTGLLARYVGKITLGLDSPGALRKLRINSSLLLTVLATFVIPLLTSNPSQAANRTVTSNLDSTSTGTLRQTISVSTAGDTIDFDPTINVINLTGGELPISNNLTINGPGARKLTINGSGSSRIFNIAGSSTTVNINNLTLTNGNIASGNGGAITNSANLTLSRVAITNSQAIATGPPGCGGGIANTTSFASLNLLESSIVGNSANSCGGGIYNSAGSTLTVNNSTISSNSASIGGGIYNDTASLTFHSATITKNITSDTISGAVDNTTGNPLSIWNSIFADNGGNDLLTGANPTTVHNSFIQTLNGSLGTDSAANTTGQPAILGPLGNNGGPTDTHALLTGSPAINNGESLTCPPYDQRGVIRPQGTVCDIGAYEALAGLVGGSIQWGSVNTNPAVAYVATLAGLAGSTGSTDGTAVAARFQNPGSITYNGTKLYVADTQNNLIREIDSSTRTVTTFAGNGTAASNDGNGIGASFNLPSGITTDGPNLYVSDLGGLKIRKIIISTGAVTSIAGTGASGDTDGTGLSASFRAPVSITTDGLSLFIADSSAAVIRRLDLSDNSVSTLAGTAGSTDSIDGIGSTARFNSPTGITTDGIYLYVSDFNSSSSSGTIRKVEIASGNVTTMAGSALGGTTDGVGVTARFSSPTGITTDGSRLFVTDKIANNIRSIDLASASVTTLAGNAPNSGSADGVGTSATLNAPMGITTDGVSLFVSEEGNSIIRKIGLMPAISISPLTYNFNSVSVGGFTVLPVTITNSGTAPLNVSNISIAGTDYSIDVNTGTPACGATPFNQSPATFCQVAVKVTPTGIGSRNGTLTISSNDQNNPSTLVTFFATAIAQSPPVILTSVLPNPTVNTPYSQFISVAGGITPYTLTATGNLPPGLTFSTSGQLNGTPTTSGSYTFTVTVTDAAAPTPLTGNMTYTVTVNGATNITGSISYAGIKTGRIYITLQDTNGGNNLGTSIASPGAYTIRGVLPGSYTVNAFMDDLNLGTWVQMSPGGNTSVTVNGSNVTGVNITLADQSPTAPPAPTNLSASPGDASVLVGWDKQRNGDIETADSYDIYWGTSSAISKTSNIGSRLNIPAGIDSPVVIEGLSNGNTLYFTVIPKSGGVEGTAATYYGPVTVGSGSGLNTVTGTITYSGQTPTGPLYAAIVDPSSKGLSRVFFTKIANPAVGANPFSVSGVPNGSYAVYSIIDMNNDLVFAAGDVMSSNLNSPVIALTGSGLSALNISLSAGNSNIFITTNHTLQTAGQTVEYFGIDAEIESSLKKPVNVTLTAAPSSMNLTFPTDVGLSKDGGWRFHFWASNPVRPVTGDTYTFTVTYDDGSSDTAVTAAVTGINDSFPANPQVSSPVTTIPVFSWEAPSPLPSSAYSYSIWINGANNSSKNWDSWDIPGSTTSVIYGTSGSQATALQIGSQYYWNISTRDQKGNRAAISTSFIPTVAGTAPPFFSLTATATQGGYITPAGVASLVIGSSQTYSVAATTNYVLIDVNVDGTSVGKIDYYTFSNITAAHSIDAVFGPDGILDPNNTTGKPALNDALILLSAVMGNLTLSPLQIKRTDAAPMTNGIPQPDGKIDIGDVLLMLRRVVGLVNW